MDQPPKSPTRKSPRYQVVLKVSGRSFNDLADYTENLSEEGVFIATEQEIDPGTQILFEISFPALVKPIRLTGEVVWRRARRGGDTPEAPGIGVRLQFGSDLERCWLRDLLRKFAPAIEAEAPSPVAPQPIPREYLILLAEDNPLTLSLFTDALRNWSSVDLSSVKVIQAESCEDAWRLIEQNPVNMLVIEWRLCTQGDFDLLAALRGRLPEGRRQIPVVVVGATIQEQRLALKAGADVFLRRPFPAKGLLQTIRSLVTTAR